MKFTSTTDGVNVTVEVPDDATLDEILDTFKGFLRASGYIIDYDSNIEIVGNISIDLAADENSIFESAINNGLYEEYDLIDDDEYDDGF